MSDIGAEYIANVGQSALAMQNARMQYDPWGRIMDRAFTAAQLTFNMRTKMLDLEREKVYQDKVLLEKDANIRKTNAEVRKIEKGLKDSDSLKEVLGHEDSERVTDVYREDVDRFTIDYARIFGHTISWQTAAKGGVNELPNESQSSSLDSNRRRRGPSFLDVGEYKND